MADLDKDEDVRTLVDTTIRKFGQLDVLVNNAAQFESHSNCEDPDAMQVYDRVMRTNLRNTFHTCFLAIPHLIRKRKFTN